MALNLQYILIPLIINTNTFTKIISIIKLLENISYMCNEWYEAVEDLNNIIYETYNITIEERRYIDSQVRLIQSEKWNYDKQR